MQNFVELIQNINSKVNSVVWGPPMLILMLLTGLYLTCGTRFFQIRRFCYTIKNTVAAIFKDRKVTKTKDEKAISQFQALATALAATVGTGQHCRRSHRDFLRRSGCGILDVDFCFARYDDELFRKCARHIFPQKKRKRRVGGRPYVLYRKRTRPKVACGYIFCFLPVCVVRNRLGGSGQRNIHGA